jgi:uncharacterized membrane protein
VILMIEAHTTDGWTRPADRTSIGFRNATILGGFAAPLFLFLAGVAVVLSAEARLGRGRSRREAGEAVVRRGLEIFILAFVFRIQEFVLSPGTPPLLLFRVDILNIMGPAIGAAAVVWALASDRRAQVMSSAAVAAGIALVTPIVRTAPAVHALPTWIQWYIQPAGDQTTFTTFPWAGFVFAGAAVGALLAAADDRQDESRLHVVLAPIAAALIVLGVFCASLPSMYRESSFWTSSPTFFAIRTGIVLLTVSILYWCQRIADATGVMLQPLDRLGRHSLFVYWIHVELVYGYASWLWRGRLPLWATVAGFGAFTVLMYGAVVLHDRIASAWQAPRQQVAAIFRVGVGSGAPR